VHQEYRGLFVLVAAVLTSLALAAPARAVPSTAQVLAGDHSVTPRSAPDAAAPATQTETSGHVARLLTFVAAPSSPDQFASIWVTYADPGAVKRLHGYAYTHSGDTPPSVPNDATDLTPEQLRTRQWVWDLSAMELPRAAGAGYAREWLQELGYDQFSVERALGAGQPPDDHGVVELVTDTAIVRDKLLGHQYEAEAAPHGYGGTLYRKFGDYEQSIRDPISRMALSSMNRVVLGPGLLVAGRATDRVANVLAAHTGAVPSLATLPAVTQVVGAIEDPSLLPGATLISGSLLGLGWAPIGVDPGRVITNSQSPEEARQAAETAMREADAMPLLPPYLLFALAYHRGTDQADRFQTFTLLYPDEAVARAAGTALTVRIAAYRSAQDGKPLLGEDVLEQLEPVIRTGEGGATVTARLRLSPDHRNLFYQRLYRRDLGFLAPGGS